MDAYRDHDGDLWIDGDTPGTVSLVALADVLNGDYLCNPGYTNIPFAEAEARFSLVATK